ncbi:MAG: sulfur carrier protein [Arenicella sp.]|jgi:sulfur carrier protein
MEVTLNNKKITIADNDILETVLELNHLVSKKGIAVAVNGSVISKVMWSKHQLNANDTIMVITATAGG